MDINIIMLNGTSRVLSVHPEATVGSLKVLIQQTLGVQVETQRLVFVNGTKTPLSDDSQPVCYYGLQQGARVSLLVSQPPPIQVFLRNPKGKLSTYDIKPDETVANFKKRVECRETDAGKGIPVDQQRLIHQDREMMEGKLSDYNVKAMSTINLNLRVRGG
ncbi:polyubiquitin-like [Sebastes umbrosus]|uniref:polyubiquitin-like n=1 Tax=Sebastes umbrosus TaxID=72105 RepID=UPI00189FD07C|nr:polyubiquitin-like [Sebastes umbrosus]XP_037633509.1 polyubiquitin-like [Sebastes umbrosus]